MSVDQRSPEPEKPAGKSPIQQLVEAFRRRDPDEFKKLVSHFEHPWLLGIATNHRGDRHVGKEFLVPRTDVNPVPDRRALYTFAEADTDLERQQIVWRNLPVFLELMHDAVDRMPTELAEVIGTLDVLIGDNILGFGPHSDTIDALVGRLNLDHAEASHIYEALETFGQIAAALLTARIGPTKQNVDISALVGGLPVVVLLLASRLDDRPQQLVEAAFATEAQPGAASGVTTGREHHSAASRLVEAEPFAPASSVLTTRLAQLPWVRTVVEAIQQNPLLAHTRGDPAGFTGLGLRLPSRIPVRGGCRDRGRSSPAVAVGHLATQQRPRAGWSICDDDPDWYRPLRGPPAGAGPDRRGRACRVERRLGLPHSGRMSDCPQVARWRRPDG